jgi:ribosomal protein S18 acetylase RimI-like enzyme
MTALRPLIDDDIEPFAAILSGMDPWLRLGYSPSMLAFYFDRPDPALTRMVLPGRGLIALRAPWLRGPYVELLAVLPEAQGQGVGRMLLDWAWSRGGDNLWACVSDFNTAARAFYVRMGFAEIAPLPGLATEGETEILLRKSR